MNVRPDLAFVKAFRHGHAYSLFQAHARAHPFVSAFLPESALPGHQKAGTNDREAFR